MTTTTPVSGQSIGTSSNVGNNLFPTKITLGASTAAVVLTLRVTNGAGQGIFDERSELEMYYAFSPISVSAAAAPELLRQNNRYVSLKLARLGSVDLAKDSEIAVVSGQYLYIWFNVPAFINAATLNAYVTEL